MTMQTLSDEMGTAEGWTRSTPADHCVCNQPIVIARTEDSLDVVLDGHPDGGPLRTRWGTYLEVNSVSDLFGRRPLVVAEVGRGGQLRAHHCPGIERRAPQ